MSFWNNKKSPENSPSDPTLNKAAAKNEAGSSTKPAPVVAKSVEAPKTTVSKTVAPVAASPTVSPTNSSSSEDLLTERYGKVRSALGPGTVIQGKLSFDTVVRIDGKLSGEIFSSKALIVGPGAVIEAKIEAAALIVMGHVRGTVKVAERLEVFSGGILEGDISSPILVVEEGAILNGPCVIPGASTVARQSVGAKADTEKSEASQVKANASTTAAVTTGAAASGTSAQLH